MAQRCVILVHLTLPFISTTDIFSVHADSADASSRPASLAAKLVAALRLEHVLASAILSALGAHDRGGEPADHASHPGCVEDQAGRLGDSLGSGGRRCGCSRTLGARRGRKELLVLHHKKI